MGTEEVGLGTLASHWSCQRSLLMADQCTLPWHLPGAQAITPLNWPVACILTRVACTHMEWWVSAAVLLH